MCGFGVAALESLCIAARGMLIPKITYYFLTQPIPCPRLQSTRVDLLVALKSHTIQTLLVQVIEELEIQLKDMFVGDQAFLFPHFTEFELLVQQATAGTQDHMLVWRVQRRRSSTQQPGVHSRQRNSAPVAAH